MIARIFILIILAIVIPDLYFDIHYLRYHKGYVWWKRLLWWLPCILLIAYTLGLTSLHNFAPDDLTWLNVYLFLIGLIVLPKAVFAICSYIGLVCCRISHEHNNWGNVIGLLLCIFMWYALIYGSTIGIHRLKINHIDVYSEDLPKAFDGYRMVQFSDAHVGTFTGNKIAILEKDIDSINAQKADAIVFTGDLQNMQPREIYPVQSLLSRLKAKDGVYSILGNHDYSTYIEVNKAVGAANEKSVVNCERKCGWTLLLNEHRVVRRGKDSIVIAGEENDGRKPFPKKGNIRKTLAGVSEQAYVIMLQHDPSAWRSSILPKSDAQLTLSGHTHGGQFELFGLRPTMLTSKEDNGVYFDGDRMLIVSPGIGGFVPFRFGVSPEIEVITLHKLK